MSLFGEGERENSLLLLLLLLPLLLHVKETKYELFLEFNAHIINE
jgi:hypothetical protein